MAKSRSSSGLSEGHCWDRFLCAARTNLASVPASRASGEAGGSSACITCRCWAALLAASSAYS